MLTPISFDNTNGYSSKDAAKNPNTYQLSDNSPRSFAPSQIDNPYWLIHKNPNEQQINRFFAGTQLGYALLNNRFKFSYQTGFEILNASQLFGVAPNAATQTSGRITNRQEDSKLFSSNLGISFEPILSSNLGLLTTLNHIYYYNKRDLNRKDGSGFAPSEALIYQNANSKQQTIIDQQRETHEVNLTTNWTFKKAFSLETSASIYNSSTINKTRFLKPSVHFSIDVTSFINLRYNAPLNYLKLFTNYNNNIKEADLNYVGYHYNSTNQSMTESPNFYGKDELSLPQGLKPQEISNYEVGFSSSWFKHRINLDINYFFSLREHAIYPIFNGNQYVLSNVGDIKNQGLEVEVGSNISLGRGFSLNINSNLSFNRPIVSKLSGTQERIAIAGFNEVSTNLIQGQPVGVILGTSYQRAGNGQLLIGDDGFPIANTNPQILGNPNPDFIGNLNYRLSWKGLSLLMKWAFKKGGEQWNGTQQLLDYYGRSKQTEQQRSISDFVFDGVIANGTVNAQAVDFYDPSLPITQNRWVRYGETGVHQDYIQKTSWLRLNEVSLNYKLPNHIMDKVFIYEINFSIYAKNLFLITNYSGVDPESTLFGFNEGVGLDLFNAPTTKQYGFKLHLSL